MATFAERDLITGAMFIQKVAKRLRFNLTTTATACHFFHTYYTHPDKETIPIYEIAGACLYLAGKSEENSVKARDIVNTSYCVLNPEAPLIPINQDYSDRKERIVDLEQIVLRSLHFDVEFEQPHLHMFAYAMSLKVSKALVQCAAAILLDGMCLPRISKMSCSMQACGSLHLASQFLNEPIQSGTKVPWYLPFDVSYSSIDDYCNALLDLYESFPELVQIVLSQ